MKRVVQQQRRYYGFRGQDGTISVSVGIGPEERFDRRLITPEESLNLRNHSPTGFEWGYCGSGPAQLALALLLDFYKNTALALSGYQQFKRQVVNRMPFRGWQLEAEEIQFWMQTSMENTPARADAYFAAKWDGSHHEIRK